jgi:radical SAM superfamily enzyme YgiQ (UPF0313 family)
MKITFVQGPAENLAIEYFSRILKKEGHKVSLIVDPQLFDSISFKNNFFKNLFKIKKILVDQVIRSKPDLVGFSLFTSEYQWALDFAASIKKRNPQIPIIFGGIHPTIVPEVVVKEKNVDIVCVGEGEQALLELAKSIDKKRKNYNIPNLWFKKNGKIIKNEIRPLLQNLDSIPFPYKNMYYSKVPPLIRRSYMIMASRGCPYQCTYCGNHVKFRVYAGKGKYVRMRSVANVMNELIWAKKQYPKLKTVCLPDDILPLNKQWMREFISRYKKEINLPFICFAHPRNIDLEMANLLKEGGCFWLNLGLQTASEENRIKLLHRVETNDEVRKAVKNCHKVGLKFSLDHILGIPFEGKKEYIEGLKFYNELRPTSINVFWLVYFPKTEIIKLARKAGYIDNEKEDKINQGKISNCAVFKLASKEEDISRSKEGEFRNFAILYILLPVIPQKIMSLIIKQKWYDKIQNIPNIFFIPAKIIASFPSGQVFKYSNEIKQMSWYIYSVLKTKWLYRRVKDYSFNNI